MISCHLTCPVCLRRSCGTADISIPPFPSVRIVIVSSLHESSWPARRVLHHSVPISSSQQFQRPLASRLVRISLQIQQHHAPTSRRCHNWPRHVPGRFQSPSRHDLLTAYRQQVEKTTGLGPRMPKYVDGYRLDSIPGHTVSKALVFSFVQIRIQD